VPLDDDVLEQVAETGLDCPFITAVHLQVVCDRSLLPTWPLACTSTMRAASPNSARLAASSSSDARRASAAASSCSFVRISRVPPLLVGSVPRQAETRARHGWRRSRQLRTCVGERTGGSYPIAVRLRALATLFVGLELELGEGLAHALVLCRGVLRGVPERRGRIRVAEHFRARGFDVRLESFDLLLRLGVLVRSRCAHGFGFVARALGFDHCLAARFELEARRLAARLERGDLVIDFRRTRDQRLRLLAVELQLLLAAVDRELQRVRLFADAGRVPSASASSIRIRPRSASTSATRAPAAVSRSRASARRARALSMDAASSRYRRANSTFSQRRSSSRSRR
jgi:hypothetical protein